MAPIETNKNQQLYNSFKWPLILYVTMACLYFYKLKGSIWFTWHPICMLVAFVGMAGNAFLIKKIGGYDNTKLHGYMMIFAVIF